MSKRLTERTDAKEKLKDRRPKAIAKYIRIAGSKVELVLNLIRGKSYTDAVSILKNTNKSSSPVVLKVVESAAANAENNMSIVKDSLFVAECYVTAGPTLKRMMPRARGRADRILKRTCHIYVFLDTMADKKTVETKVEKSTKKAVTNKVDKKEIPNTVAEKPIADKPNAGKPLGTKKVVPVKIPTPKSNGTVKGTGGDSKPQKKETEKEVK
jgi:large subunit ribosomal protein L22